MHLAFVGLDQKRVEQPPPITETACPGMHAEVQNVSFAGRHRHDCVARHRAVEIEHETVISGQKTISENCDAPGLVCRPFDARHGLEVRWQHEPNLRARFYGGTHESPSSSKDFSRHKSCHALAFAAGERKR